MILSSIPLGPAMPNGPLATMMSVPTSFNVGTSGQFFVRASLKKTSCLNWPAFTCGGPSGRVGYRVDMAAEQCINRVCYTLEWRADPSNTLLLRDPKHGRIWQAVRSDYSIIDLAWPRFRICRELKKCSPGRVASHRDAEGVGADTDNVAKVRSRIVGCFPYSGCSPKHGCEEATNFHCTRVSTAFNWASSFGTGLGIKLRRGSAVSHTSTMK
jgi:hypothetical protein